MDRDTIEVIASLLDVRSIARQQEADDAWAGTGIFEAEPGTAKRADLPTIALINGILANAFAELARDFRNAIG